jgi:hypothetical protein
VLVLVSAFVRNGCDLLTNVNSGTIINDGRVLERREWMAMEVKNTTWYNKQPKVPESTAGTGN